MIGERKLLARLDQMLEDGINGTFAESDFDESRLSRLESRWFQYLTASKLSRQNVEREREKLKELVSDISHQTKTPLANILLYTQLLEEQELDAQSRQLAEEIRVQAEKLEFLIQSLVKTSRLETGTFQLTPEVNNVEELIRAAAEQAAARAEEKGMQIRILPMEEAVGAETGDYGEIVKPEEQSTAAGSSGAAVKPEVSGADASVSSGAKAAPCTARFDRKWTCEALFNILDNAVKYSPENSTVSIGIDSYEMFRCVRVADQGVGIAEEELPKIFRRFYRGQNVRQESGVGIGLYLSRQIVEGQGGYIRAESELGKGSVFRVFLPV